MTILHTFDCGAAIDLDSALSVPEVTAYHLSRCRACPTDREQEIHERIETVRTTERIDAAVADGMNANKANEWTADGRMLELPISGDALAIGKACRPRKDAA